QAETFGFHLASLEVRQHSDVHAEVLAEIAPPAAGDAIALEGSPKPTETRSQLAMETLDTFRTMARLQERFGANACRRVIVSFTRSAADVAGVRALAAIAVPDGRLELDVVPLFESRRELETATEILDEVLALPGTQRRLADRHRRMEVMLGYSDSAKESGVLAANLLLYDA